MHEFWVNVGQLQFSPLCQGTKTSLIFKDYLSGTPLHFRAITVIGSNKEEILAHTPVSLCTATFGLQNRWQHLAFAKQRIAVSVFALMPAVSL